VFYVCGGKQGVLGVCKIHMQKGKQLQILDMTIINATDSVMSIHSIVATSVIK
jgi:hypothetical protein